MKHAQFDYVNQFHCLAGDCPDTCCKDWQIILDEDALARYRAMPGPLGEQVRAALVTENGETRFREEGGRCVLLRDDGLCPIQAAYGAEALCRTCYTHPRFTEEYGQTAELTLSLSCPEAARLLLTHEAPLRIETQDDGGPVVPNELDPELYPALLAARQAFFRLAQDRQRNAIAAHRQFGCRSGYAAALRVAAGHRQRNFIHKHWRQTQILTGNANLQRIGILRISSANAVLCRPSSGANHHVDP